MLHCKSAGGQACYSPGCINLLSHLYRRGRGATPPIAAEGTRSAWSQLQWSICRVCSHAHGILRSPDVSTTQQSNRTLDFALFARLAVAHLTRAKCRGVADVHLCGAITVVDRRGSLLRKASLLLSVLARNVGRREIPRWMLWTRGGQH